MAEVFDREFAWDDEIEKDSDFVIIPEGDYTFTVSGFERGRHEGSEKLPPCPKAIVKLRVDMPDGTTQELTHNLFLHSKCEGLLSAFFVGIGQKKHGEKLRELVILIVPPRAAVDDVPVEIRVPAAVIGLEVRSEGVVVRAVPYNVVRAPFLQLGDVLIHKRIVFRASVFSSLPPLLGSRVPLSACSRWTGRRCSRAACL